MKDDLRLFEYYKTLEGRKGFSSEILLHEARTEFRRAWRRDFLRALLVGDCGARAWAGAGAGDRRHAPGASCDDGRARRLRLGMENAWLWLYYRDEAYADESNPLAARILASKEGCDRLQASSIRERLAGRLALVRVGGAEPGNDAECILGSR